MRNIKRKNGFTLVETLLVVGMISLGSTALYSVGNRVYSGIKADSEAKFLNYAFNQIEKGVTSVGVFSGISESNIANLGVNITNSNVGIDSISSPANDQLNFNYRQISSSVCTAFVNKMIRTEDNISAVVNGVDLPARSSLGDVSSACNRTSNTLAIVLINPTIMAANASMVASSSGGGGGGSSGLIPISMPISAGIPGGAGIEDFESITGFPTPTPPEDF